MRPCISIRGCVSLSVRHALFASGPPPTPSSAVAPDAKYSTLFVYSWYISWSWQPKQGLYTPNTGERAFFLHKCESASTPPSPYKQHQSCCSFRCAQLHTCTFLAASSHLYKRVCPPVGLPVRRSARHAFSKTAKIAEVWTANELAR